jgi:hypothetical protein
LERQYTMSGQSSRYTTCRKIEPAGRVLLAFRARVGCHGRSVLA